MKINFIYVIYLIINVILLRQCYFFFKKQNVIKNLTRFFTELRLFYVIIMINM